MYNSTKSYTSSTWLDKLDGFLVHILLFKQNVNPLLSQKSFESEIPKTKFSHFLFQIEFDKVRAENVELQSEKQALINKLKRYEPTPNIMWSPNIWRIQKQL